MTWVAEYVRNTSVSFIPIFTENNVPVLFCFVLSPLLEFSFTGENANFILQYEYILQHGEKYLGQTA